MITIKRRSSLIAGVPGDGCSRTRQLTSSSSTTSSGVLPNDNDFRAFIVGTPEQLKRRSILADAGCGGLLTNGRPIQKKTSTIAKPRSRRSSIAGADSPRFVTTPGSIRSPRFRRASVSLEERKIDKRRLSLSLVFENNCEDANKQTVYALISPQQKFQQPISYQVVANILNESADTKCNSAKGGTAGDIINLHTDAKDMVELTDGEKAIKPKSPISPNHRYNG